MYSSFQKNVQYIISDSKYFNNEETIIDNFAYELNYFIIEDEILLSDCNIFNTDLKSDKNVIYVKDDLLLIKIVVKNIPVFAEDSEKTNFR